MQTRDRGHDNLFDPKTIGHYSIKGAVCAAVTCNDCSPIDCIAVHPPGTDVWYAGGAAVAEGEAAVCIAVHPPDPDVWYVDSVFANMEGESRACTATAIAPLQSTSCRA